jgi:hypothetical protein
VLIACLLNLFHKFEKISWSITLQVFLRRNVPLSRIKFKLRRAKYPSFEHVSKGAAPSGITRHVLLLYKVNLNSNEQDLGQIVRAIWRLSSRSINL